MAKSLEDFLTELDTNAELKEAYLADPVATAEEYGLAQQDVSLIKNQDWDKVRQQFEESGKAIKVHTY